MTFNFTKLNRLVLEQNEWELPGSSERKIPLEVVILISHVLGLGFSSCTSFLLKHRYNQVVLGHQIVLRHKYCESPAQMRLVFKYVEYLPVMKVGV